MDSPEEESEVSVKVKDRLKRYVTRKREYNYFGPFTVEEVKIISARRDEEGVGLYDIRVQCLGDISWMITLRYAQLYESYKWQVKYDKEKRLPLTFQFPPKDTNSKFYKYKALDDDALEARREGLEKWINGRISLIHNYESEPDIMSNIRKEMSHLLKIGHFGPSLHQYNRSSTISSSEMEKESIFSVEDVDRGENRGESGDNARFYDLDKPDAVMSDDDEDGSSDESETIKKNNESSEDNKVCYDNITCPTSYMYTQCRSIWTPKNWVYALVIFITFLLWSFSVHIVYTLLLAVFLVEFGRQVEDYILFDSKADVIADRQYSLTGMVRVVFAGLIITSYSLFQVIYMFLHYARDVHAINNS